MLDELLNLEAQCKEAVEAEQWSTCSELFIQRMKLLEKFAKTFSDSEDFNQLELLKAHFSKLSQDMEIIQKIHSKTKDELIKITKSGRAISAYDASRNIG